MSTGDFKGQLSFQFNSPQDPRNAIVLCFLNKQKKCPHVAKISAWKCRTTAQITSNCGSKNSPEILCRRNRSFKISKTNGMCPRKGVADWEAEREELYLGWGIDDLWYTTDGGAEFISLFILRRRTRGAEDYQPCQCPFWESINTTYVRSRPLSKTYSWF